MQRSLPDLNLLAVLDALLAEGSVTRAARRLHLSVPAASRALARARAATGDAILVRAGRGLVPTPRALAMRAQVRALVLEADRVLGGARPEEPSRLERHLTIRADDGLLLVVGEALLGAARREAPGVTLGFRAEGDESVAELREGVVDLDVGVQGALGPEVRVQTVHRDRAVALVRAGSPLSRGALTLRRLAAAEHVVRSRHGRFRPSRLDELLGRADLARRVRVVVPTSLALALTVARSDAVAIVLSTFAAAAARVLPVRAVALPFALEPTSISLAWHPRFDRDPAHAWLRQTLQRLLGELAPAAGRARTGATSTR